MQVFLVITLFTYLNLPFFPLSAIGVNQFPSEVITYEQWAHMKPESKNMLSEWFKGAFQGGMKEMKESIHQQLNFVLSTAPMWDRFGSSYVYSSPKTCIRKFFECKLVHFNHL